MGTVAITEQNFASIIEKGIVIIDWWAGWCGPCRVFAPIFERAAAAHPDIVFGRIEADCEPRLQAEFRIHSVPTLMAFRDGVLVLMQPGALPPLLLERLIEQIRAIDMNEVRRVANKRT